MDQIDFGRRMEGYRRTVCCSPSLRHANDCAMHRVREQLPHRLTTWHLLSRTLQGFEMIAQTLFDFIWLRFLNEGA